MKNKMRLAVALGAVVALWAVAAFGDYNVLDKTTYYQNATSGQRTNATGDLRVDDMSRDRDQGTIISSGLGTINSLAPGTSVVCPTAVNISTYSRITLLLTWNFAAAADSDSVNVVVNLYGKTSANMSDGINNQLIFRLPSQGVSASATTDTAKVWFPTGVAASITSKPVPTLYITRNAVTGVNYTGVAYNHGASWIGAMQPRWFWTGVGSCAIALDNIPGIGSYPYLGVSISNCNVTKTLTSVTASYWVSR